MLATSVRWTALCMVVLSSVSVDAQPGRINEINGRHMADVLLEAGAGAGFFQNYIDQNTDTQSIFFEDREMLDDLLSVLKQKITTRAFSVQMIVNFVKDHMYEFKVENDITECCNVDLSPDYYSRLYQSRVDTDSMCYMTAPNQCKTDKMSIHMKPTSRLASIFYVNYKAIELGGLRHQYLGMEDGLFIRYPSVKLCDDFDPRAQPWYRSAANVKDKAITILFDASEDTAAQFGDTTLLDLTKDAIRAIMRSTNNKDTVAVIPMTDSPKYRNSTKVFSDCFAQNFMYVSDKVKADVDTFLDLLVANGTGMPSEYIETAFQSFEEYPYNFRVRPKEKTRDFVFFYLSSVELTEDTESFMKEFVNKSKDYHDPLLLLYQIGDNPIVTETLKYMQMAYTLNGGKAEFDVIIDRQNLYRFPQYYHHLPLNVDEKVKFTYPSRDRVSNESVITVSAPIIIGNKLMGVAAVDLAVYDLLSELVSFKLRKDDYVFLIDIQNMLIMYHPLAPLPSEIIGEASPVYLSMMIYKMPFWVYGDFLASGYTSFVFGFEYTRIFSKGQSYTDGVYEVLNVGLLNCKPIHFESLNLQLCMIPKLDFPFFFIKTVLIKELSKKEIRYKYHKYEFGSNETDTVCRSFYRRTYAVHSSVKFSPRSFISPSWYKYHEETEVDAEHFHKIIIGEAANNRFVDRVVDDVKITSFLEEEWLTGNLKFETVTHTVWRYIGTTTGVLRTQPTMLGPTALDPSKRLWYIKAISEPGTRVITTPYRDAYGAGYVISVATAIFEKGSDEIFGVIGIDITLHYMQFLVETNFYQECAEAGYICFLMDNSGYIIVHPDWVTTTVTEEIKVERVHIIDKEPFIAYHMIQNGFLKREKCTDIYQGKDRTFYQVNLDGTTASHETNDTRYYKMVHADNSNFYVIQKVVDPIYSNATDVCLCNEWDNVCRLRFEECECPCAADAPYDVCKLDVFIHWESDYKPCAPPLADPYDEANLYLGGDYYIDYEGLDFCIPRECSKQLNLGECHSVAHCRWCSHDVLGKPLITPYCGVYDECWFGQVGRGTLYPEGVREKTKQDILLIIGISVGCTLLALLILGLIAYRVHLYLERQKFLKEEILTEEEDRFALKNYVRKRRGAIGDIRRTSQDKSLDEEAKNQEEDRKKAEQEIKDKRRATNMRASRRYSRKSIASKGVLKKLDDDDEDDEMGDAEMDEALNFEALKLVRMSMAIAAEQNISPHTEDEEEEIEIKVEEMKHEEDLNSAGSK